jgi:hypothetical protein
MEELPRRVAERASAISIDRCFMVVIMTFAEFAG